MQAAIRFAAGQGRNPVLLGERETPFRPRGARDPLPLGDAGFPGEARGWRPRREAAGASAEQVPKGGMFVFASFRNPEDLGTNPWLSHLARGAGTADR